MKTKIVSDAGYRRNIIKLATHYLEVGDFEKAEEIMHEYNAMPKVRKNRYLDENRE